MAGSSPVTVSAGEFFAGLPLFVLVIAAAGFAAAVLTRALTPALPRLESALVGSLWFTAAVIAEHVLPLALGIMSRASVAAACVLLAALAWGVSSRLARPASQETTRTERDEGPLAVRVIGIGAAVLVAGAALGYLRHQLGQPIVGTDGTNFQVPVVARWIQSGSMWQLDQFFPDYSNATYPHHGNVLLLATVLPWDSAFLVRYVPAAYAVLAGVGIFAAARELGADRGWSLLAPATVLAIPIVAKTAVAGAQTDTPMLAVFSIGSLFLLRHARTRARSDLLLAGLGYGLALGTKWYAVTTLGPLLVVWAIALLLAGRGAPRCWKTVAGWALTLGATILVVGGIWMLRNLVEAGNPVFPQALGPIDAPPDPLRALADWTLLEYTLRPSIWTDFLLPQFNEYFSAPGYLLVALLPIGFVAALRAEDRRVTAVAVAGIAMFLAYYSMPFSAFGRRDAPILAFASMRYAVPALIAGALLLAWAGSRLRTRARAGCGAVVALAVLVGVLEEYRPGEPLGQIVAVSLALAAGVWLAPRVVPRIAERRSLGLAALLSAILAVVGVMFVVRDRANERGTYASLDPVLAWIEANAPTDTSIGVTGLWSVDAVSPVLPAFGPRLRNEVTYIGPFEQHMLRQYRDEDAFVARLRRDRDELLIVGRGSDPKGPVVQERWARRAGYVPVVQSRRLALLRRMG